MNPISGTTLRTRRRACSLRAMLIVATLALLTALGACSANGDRDGGDAFRPLAVGDTVPAYVAHTLAGDTVRVGGAGTEPLTLVNVWATWCTSCREEFADLEALTRTYAPRGLRVVAVSVDKGSADKVARFVKAQGATFTVAHDPEGRIEQRFQVVGVPSSYLIAPDGHLLWSYVGTLPKDDVTQVITRSLGS